MIRKTYKSKSDIALNIVLKNGKSAHISFTPLTGGGSMYKTADEDLQQALEKSAYFGSLFKVVEAVNMDEVAPAKEVERVEPRKTKVVKVSCLSDAKDYLANTYGVSRTNLKGKTSIVETAEGFGVEFDGI